MSYAFFLSMIMTGCGGGGGGGDSVLLTPIPNATVSGCFVEDYQDPAASPYVLPYQVGMSFLVNNGNCGLSPTHQPVCTVVNANGRVERCGDARYAYDFAMPIGIVVTAARGGKVTLVVDGFSNATNGGDQDNQVNIQHDDGSVGSYIHFSPNSIFVSVGDLVSKGDPIGLSGSSGFTTFDPAFPNPHLHFYVSEPPFINCNPPVIISGCRSAPVTFNNANPPDVPLIQGTTYEALPHSH
ncbi:MAG: M23 family metallopeptidase [Pseudomonadota bacterium]